MRPNRRRFPYRRSWTKSPAGDSATFTCRILVQKRQFYAMFILKINIVPRQARDNIEKTQKKSGVSLGPDGYTSFNRGFFSQLGKEVTAKIGSFDLPLILGASAAGPASDKQTAVIPNENLS
eukprot:COSAG06_NODE_1593_length_8986_cov_6.740578_8_plen_122_part_00